MSDSDMATGTADSGDSAARCGPCGTGAAGQLQCGPRAVLHGDFWSEQSDGEPKPVEIR